MTRQMHVVVFQENDLVTHLRVTGKLEQSLDQFFAFVIFGMGLARKDKLNRIFFVIDDRYQAIRVLQE